MISHFVPALYFLKDPPSSICEAAATDVLAEMLRIISTGSILCKKTEHQISYKINR